MVATSILRGSLARYCRLHCGSVPSRCLQTKASQDVADSVQNLKSFSEIPGPKALPVVGNMLSILFHNDFKTTEMIKLWKSYFEEYGPIFKLTVPMAPTIVGSLNPDDIETILKTTMHNPIREAFRSLKMIRDDAPNNYFDKKSGLLPENGDEWWRLRSRVQTPLLRPKNVANYLPKVDNATLKFVDNINAIKDKNGKVPDNFLQELYKWALECVGLVALDRELGCLEPNLSDDSLPLTMIRHVNDMFSAMNETEMGLQTWRLFRSAPYVKLETAHNAFLEISDKFIQEIIQDLEAAKAAGNENTSPSVMQTFLNTEGLSKSDVTTMVLDMLFAGVDTTSHTMGFTLYLLAKNPDTQRILQKEIDSVMGNSEKLLPEHIAKMPYLNYVLKESLRIYPLTMGTGRILTEEINMSGYKVPAGTLAAGMNCLIGTEEKYFTRANEFLPERWNRSRPHGPIHPYASVPFSHGKRMCIGKRIAEQEIYALLIRLMQKYTVSYDSDRQMSVITQLVFKPSIPLSFTFKERN